MSTDLLIPGLVQIDLGRREDEPVVEAWVKWTCHDPACGLNHRQLLLKVYQEIVDTEVGKAALLVFATEMAKAWVTEILGAPVEGEIGVTESVVAQAGQTVQ